MGRFLQEQELWNSAFPYAVTISNGGNLTRFDIEPCVQGDVSERFAQREENIPRRSNPLALRPICRREELFYKNQTSSIDEARVGSVDSLTRDLFGRKSHAASAPRFVQ